MSAALVRPATAMAWELRAAWATGRRVALSLAACDQGRIEGHVSQVAASGAFATVRGMQVPLDRVLAVHMPSLLGDSTAKPSEPWRGRARLNEPQKERLWAA